MSPFCLDGAKGTIRHIYKNRATHYSVVDNGPLS